MLKKDTSGATISSTPLPQLKSCQFQKIVVDDQGCQLGEKKTLGDFILKTVVMTTLRHTTKKQTTPLSVVLELGSRIFPTPGLF
jgi:hypothetical protein